MVEVVNQTKVNLSKDLLARIVNKIAKYLKIKKLNLSIAFISLREMKKLNYIYLGKNKPTDILSFSYSYDKKVLDGEIVICYSIAKQQAKQLEHSLKQEITHLLIHGLVHLVGYDHLNKTQAQQMAKIEKELGHLFNLKDYV